MTSRMRVGFLVVLALLGLLPAFSAHAGPDDHVYAFGDATFHGSTGVTPLPAPIVDMAAHPSGTGYWLVTGKGRVHSFGGVGFFGDTGFITLNSPIVALAATPSGNGYWFSAEDGGIFSFGDASFFGSAFGASAPIVDLRPTPTGNGYWQLESDGTVHARGAAVHHGDLTGIPLAHPLVAMAITPSGNGYWLLADDGGIFTFGDAAFFGSPAVTAIEAVDIVARPTGDGYWVAGANGIVTNHGLAPALGSAAPSRPITAMVATTTGAGYWLADEGNGPPPPGAIEGTVVDDTGAPAPGVCVTVYMSFTAASWDHGFGTTDAAGHYRIEDLDAGDYSVYFSDCDGQDYLSSIRPGTVAVTSGATTSGVDGVVARAGSVTGVVTGPTGSPVEGVCVNVMTEDRMRGASGFTSSTGYYRAGGLSTGDYHVEFTPCSGASGDLAAEWWNDQPTESTADVVHVDVGTSATGIDAELAVGAEVNGVVTDEGGVPLANVCVSAYHESGDTAARGGFTSSTGYYRVRNLPAGTYKVRYSDCYIWDSGSYAPEWWDNQPSRTAADPITLAGGQVRTDVDAALGLAGTASGVVTDVDGSPIQHMCVRAYDSDGIESAYAQTSSTGFYTLGGLGTTSYAVRADDCLLGRHGYMWYDGRGTRSAADAVPVTAGSETTGIDFTLLAAGTLAGSVTDGEGNQLDRVCVDAYDPAGAQVSGTQTSSTGYYSITGLHAQSYRVHFEDCGGRGLPAEWYDNQADLASATPVPVAAGATSTANAVLGEPTTTVPDAPTNVVATAGNASADVSWTAPASDGGSTITSYTVTASPGGATATVSGGTTVTPEPATSATVTGLTNGTTYTFTVRATNSVGNSAESAASNAVTPADVPGAPLRVTARATGTSTATVSWDPPATNGGSAITGYRVTASGGTVAFAGPTARSVEITGLTAGQTYTFTVAASNAIGYGAESAPSKPVTTRKAKPGRAI